MSNITIRLEIKDILQLKIDSNETYELNYKLLNFKQEVEYVRD